MSNYVSPLRCFQNNSPKSSSDLTSATTSAKRAVDTDMSFMVSSPKKNSTTDQKCDNRGHNEQFSATPRRYNRDNQYFTSTPNRFNRGSHSPYSPNRNNSPYSPYQGNPSPYSPFQSSDSPYSHQSSHSTYSPNQNRGKFHKHNAQKSYYKHSMMEDPWENLEQMKSDSNFKVDSYNKSIRRNQ